MEAKDFIIIDDDRISTLICEECLNAVFPDNTICKFDNPVDALMHLGMEYGEGKIHKPTLLFLDIYMPAMNGWEFLECYSNFDEKIKNQIKIIVLSSSADLDDKKRAMANIYVSEFMVKPLRQDVLHFILTKYKKAA